MGGAPGPYLPPTPKAHFWVFQRAQQAGGGENGAVWVCAAWRRQVHAPHPAGLADSFPGASSFFLEIRADQIS